MTTTSWDDERMSNDLREVHGDIRVTRPGSVLADLAVHGAVTVEAANVTVRNCLVRGAAPTQRDTPPS